MGAVNRQHHLIKPFCPSVPSQTGNLNQKTLSNGDEYIPAAWRLQYTANAIRVRVTLPGVAVGHQLALGHRCILRSSASPLYSFSATREQCPTQSRLLIMAPEKIRLCGRLVRRLLQGRACRTRSDWVQQSSSIVPFIANGGLRSIFANSLAVSDMSSCSDAELWESFDGAEYNNSSLSDWLWGGMQNVCDNLHRKCNTLLQWL